MIEVFDAFPPGSRRPEPNELLTRFIVSAIAALAAYALTACTVTLHAPLGF